jgi:hypothetical protein
MSDYIERLRGELLRVEATRPRPRPRVRPVLALTAVAAIVATALVFMPGPADREVPAGATYRVEGDAQATANVLRERMAAAGIPGSVEVSADTLTIPDAARALAVPGDLAIYDWERSLIGGPEPVTEHEADLRGGKTVRSEDGSGWLALRGRPALDNAEVAGARASLDPMTREPIVLVQLTPAGREAFHDLTRTLAQRGRGDDLQHLAIVIDDRVYSVPFIDGRITPDGIDGAEGTHISGSLTRAQARELAAVLDSGPLPGELRVP